MNAVDKILCFFASTLMFAFCVFDVWVNLGHIVIHIGPFVSGIFFAVVVSRLHRRLQRCKTDAFTVSP